MKTILALVLAVLPQLVWAACVKPQFTDPSQVNLTADTLMIVTHASSAYDPRLASKRGIEDAIRYAKTRRVPLVYLADNNAGSAEHYFTEDCSPDYWVFSEEGEIRFNVRASNVLLVGGHLEVCLSNTLVDVMAQWARQPRRDLRVTYFMDGIYSNGKDIDQSDVYYKDYLGFMNVVTYGRPSGEQWPKLTLLETMALITNEKRQLDYLERVLPVYSRFVPTDYRVELQVNDSTPKVLQPGRGAKPLTLRFHFLDSASMRTEQALLRPASAD